ncbi:MAG: PilZ domain-containing protein [Fuerstiella sp.]
MCASLDSGFPLPVVVEDVARGDIRFLTDRPLRFGTRLHMSMYIDLASGSIPHRGVVHWCRPCHQGWQIGVFLNGPIPNAIMSKSWWELRNSLRYESNWQAWIDVPDRPRRAQIQVLNYSQCGVRIRCPDGLAVGDTFRICNVKAGDSPALVSGYVERIDANPGEYGCFLKNYGGRFLPGMFGQSTALHVESSVVRGIPCRDAILPEMILILDADTFATDPQHEA